MPELVVNNINIVVERRRKRFQGVPHGANSIGANGVQASVDAGLVRRVEAHARQLKGISCSSSWLEDCFYRGVQYAPDFRCQCRRCKAKFPDRLHPRSARQSDYSEDCQMEMDDDPEFAEEFALLRNSRDRVGSAFTASRVEKNLGRSMRGAP